MVSVNNLRCVITFKMPFCARVDLVSEYSTVIWRADASVIVEMHCQLSMTAVSPFFSALAQNKTVDALVCILI